MCNNKKHTKINFDSCNYKNKIPTFTNINFRLERGREELVDSSNYSFEVRYLRLDETIAKTDVMVNEHF
jgi:predicted subunit of tRNA(5-methylaminomethyl-2-thiouridylate) methyltransferase